MAMTQEYCLFQLAEVAQPLFQFNLRHILGQIAQVYFMTATSNTSMSNLSAQFIKKRSRPSILHITYTNLSTGATTVAAIVAIALDMHFFCRNLFANGGRLILYHGKGCV
jgi:hypothetical protein